MRDIHGGQRGTIREGYGVHMAGKLTENGYAKVCTGRAKLTENGNTPISLFC